MRILITGSNGLLGQKIVGQCLKNNIDFCASSKGNNRNMDCPSDHYVEMDITSDAEVLSVFKAYHPTHVIHTAAMTNVDQCELDALACKEINTIAVERLFRISKSFNAHFQLLSTDFVFDGEVGNYSEDDEVNPLSEYARSKVEAEKVLLADTSSNWSIARTIIVYGEGHQLTRSNIVLWAVDALRKGEPLNIVDDQFRAPTWADDLAWGCIQICRKNAKGIYHLCGPETFSVYEMVCRIATYLGISTDGINRVQTNTLTQPAKRPAKTGFNLSKSRTQLGYAPKTLEATLALMQTISNK
jgi:dTDP-4-dehydrorhamnose reductase